MNCKEISIIDNFLTEMCKHDCHIDTEDGNGMWMAITMKRVSELTNKLVKDLKAVQQDPLAPCQCDCDCCEKEDEPCPSNGRDCE